MKCSRSLNKVWFDCIILFYFISAKTIAYYNIDFLPIPRLNFKPGSLIIVFDLYRDNFLALFLTHEDKVRADRVKPINGMVN